MSSNCPGINLEPGLGTYGNKIEHLSLYAHVVHTTAKQLISRRRKNENVYKMSKHEKCTCKACKNAVFHCQICKFVRFLLPSSLWLLKLPNGLRVVQFVNCISLKGLSGSHALRTKNIPRVLSFGAFTFSERKTCIVLSMFVSPAIHGSYEFGRIAYHQYVNIYAVHQLCVSSAIVSRSVRDVRVVSSHSRVVSQCSTVLDKDEIRLNYIQALRK